MEDLIDKIRNYSRSDYYPLHMPGHKRNMEGHPLEDAFQMDLTEIEGFDNMHAAGGILKEAMERAAAVFGAEQTFFLVNGSTAGVLSAVSAVCRKKDKLILARNSHKSAYHAVYQLELKCVYLYPDMVMQADILAAVRPEQVEELLADHPDAAAVMITSPTYEGIAANVSEIAEICHRRRIPLIVDNAHGAHFGFHECFPGSAVRAGADLVIQSLHKTLPALTQTALLHVNGCLVDRERLKRFLGIYQTSSPSYVLMSSMDWCVGYLEKHGRMVWEPFCRKVEGLHEKLRSLRYLHAVDPADFREKGMNWMDMGKLIISTRNAAMDGGQLYDMLLHRYHLQLEMAGGSYVTAILTMQDTARGLERLVQALQEIDERLSVSSTGYVTAMLKPMRRVSLAEALEAQREAVSFAQAAGRTNADFITPYPPGIPLIVPGEIISEEVLEEIRRFTARHLPVQGLIHDDKEIWVMKDSMDTSHTMPDLQAERGVNK